MCFALIWHLRTTTQVGTVIECRSTFNRVLFFFFLHLQRVAYATPFPVLKKSNTLGTKTFGYAKTLHASSAELFRQWYSGPLLLNPMKIRNKIKLGQRAGVFYSLFVLLTCEVRLGVSS